MRVPRSTSDPDLFAPQRAPPGRPGQLQSTDLIWSAEAHRALPSVPQFADLAVSQLTQCLQSLRTVRKQVKAACLIPTDDDPAPADQMIYPVGFDPHGRGQLRHGEAPGDALGTRFAVAMQALVLQAKRLDRAGQDPGSLRGAKPLRRQPLGDDLIGVPLRLQA